MYLKYIRANGFKSFADKTELEIKPGITGVVGPNGSGKSNIVDAIRWVLGEQSVKALRGDSQMSDVIFAGSKTRDGDSRAIVSLTFDNSDHYLNSEFNEIEVKRVLYKTGENDYYLNDTKVRLKDITDLFLDTGASKESFNIISQGAVSDVINNKPENRRVIFEEAAGVLKYKKRKEETLRKLAKTNENIEKVTLLIDELETTLTPLKEQAIVARKYLDYKNELENQEIALIAEDITNINKDYKTTKDEVDKLSKEIQELSINYSSDDSELEKLKLESLKLDTAIENKNKDIMTLVSKLGDLQSKKQITIERKKYEVDDQKLENNIISLKEDILSIDNKISLEKKELEQLDSDFKTKSLENMQYKNIVKQLDKDKLFTFNNINNTEKEILALKNKIEILEDNISNDSKLPFAVKSVLNNTRLDGIHNTLGKLLEVKDIYTVAIETAIGGNTNVIVVDNESSAKKAITYLKENKLGRATFYPLNVIKGKYIDKEIISKIDSDIGYIGIAADLVDYDKKYKNVINRELGNVIVTKDIDSLNRIGKLLEYKFKIVSLDGEILYTGGAIAGGASRINKGIISEKKDLLDKQKQLEDLINNKEDLDKEYKSIIKDYDKNLALSNKLDTELSIIEEKKQLKDNTLKELLNNKKLKEEELKGTENVSNKSLDKELDKILKEYYEVSNNKEILDKELSKIKSNKFELTDKIQQLEKKYREFNSEYTNKQNILKNKEVKLGKLDVKLDGLLLQLNESYNMTYEKAAKDYSLDTDIDSARINVNKLKANIKELGEVNTGSIAEYDRLNTRFEFLSKQKEDLELSIDNLLKIINEMDEIMKTNFIETFNKIKVEFQKVFKILFKGGEGILELTNPDNLLETGIEISALPPGKKLNSIALLSGGEKTLTAIALLFAILNVKPVPFVVLDEVEAALDEVNVESFGNYLKTKKDKSQFIIITHKKKTMEYADLLYGITMQESGVSKIVSVRLEDR